CHLHYPALSRIVEEACRAHEVRYRCEPTLRSAWPRTGAGCVGWGPTPLRSRPRVRSPRSPAPHRPPAAAAPAPNTGGTPLRATAAVAASISRATSALHPPPDAAAATRARRAVAAAHAPGASDAAAPRPSASP